MPKVADISSVLPEDDCMFLQDKYPNHEVYQVGADIHVHLNEFSLPEAYAPRSTTVLLKLPAGYPNAAPDMFWTKPDVKLLSGAWPEACAHHEVPGSGPGAEIYENVAWQRWSRHFQGSWKVGIHGLPFFVMSIIQDLKHGI